MDKAETRHMRLLLRPLRWLYWRGMSYTTTGHTHYTLAPYLTVTGVTHFEHSAHTYWYLVLCPTRTYLLHKHVQVYQNKMTYKKNAQTWIRNYNDAMFTRIIVYTSENRIGFKYYCILVNMTNGNFGKCNQVGRSVAYTVSPSHLGWMELDDVSLP